MRHLQPTIKGTPSMSQDGKSILWEGRRYLPIDDTGTYYYDSELVIGVPMPSPRMPLESILKRYGFHGLLRCELVDYVDCTKKDHGFIDDGRSRVMKLGDGETYRLSAAGGGLSWFSYFLKTRAKPGRPHLVVVQTINDLERYTTVTLTVPDGKPWAAPYSGEEKQSYECQEPHCYNPDVGGCVYTGREYPTDGKSFNYIFLYYPKAEEVKITISHVACEEKYREKNGAAVARIWVFDILDSLTSVAPALPYPKMNRKLALYVPHPWFLYSHYGVPARTREQRLESLKSFIGYMKFCGFNQLQFHVINGSDIAGCAWYDSEIYPMLQGNLLGEIVPLAAESGIETVPIITPIVTPFRGNLEEIPETPDENGFCRLSLQLNREGEYTNSMGCFIPDPLRPEVQE